MDFAEIRDELHADFPEYTDEELESLMDFVDAVVRYVIVTDFEDRI